jgi:hypothetical protein
VKPIAKPNEQELAFIYQKAKERNDLAAKEGRFEKNKQMMPGVSTLEKHEFGTAGEQMAAKALNKYPTGLFESYAEDTDLGGHQVRCRSEQWQELWVVKDDPDDAYYILICGTVDTYFRVHGFVHATEAKQEKYWRKSKGDGSFPRIDCYVIPTADLSQDWALLD